MLHKEYENVLLDIDEQGIATLKLNRPKALNALYGPLNRDMLAAIEEVLACGSARVLIMTGMPKAFAAGADLKEMLEVNPREARAICQLAKDINEKLESMPIPTIAAVSGFAFGGGFELALSCDFRVGGSRTTVSFPEVGLGIIPGANGMIRACHIVGPSKAKELSMLNTMVTGEEAYRLGLLNWYVEGDGALAKAAADAKKSVSMAKLTGIEAAVTEAKKVSKEADNAFVQSEFDAIYAKALDIAKQLCTKPARALESVKKVIYDAANVSGQQGKIREEIEFPLLFDTHDQREGMSAFGENRSPNYTNN